MNLGQRQLRQLFDRMFSPLNSVVVMRDVGMSAISHMNVTLQGTRRTRGSHC